VRYRRAMRASLIALTTAVVLAGLAGSAAAAPTRSCGSTDRTNPALMADPHGAFGIFDIRATGVSCASAKVETHAYYESQIRRSDPVLHSVVRGYKCFSPTRATVAQQIKVTCTKGSARIRFTWELASG
jgi:hypothetical protein